jgi:hypothetical protein
MEEQFWTWLASWAVFMQKPSDLGYSDEGYDLPPLKVHWHCVAVDHKKAWKQTDRRGQAALFLDKSSGLKDIAEVKRETILARLEKAKEIMSSASDGWKAPASLAACGTTLKPSAMIEKLIPNVHGVRFSGFGKARGYYSWFLAW